VGTGESSDSGMHDTTSSRKCSKTEWKNWRSQPMVRRGDQLWEGSWTKTKQERKIQRNHETVNSSSKKRVHLQISLVTLVAAPKWGKSGKMGRATGNLKSLEKRVERGGHKNLPKEGSRMVPHTKRSPLWVRAQNRGKHRESGGHSGG